MLQLCAKFDTSVKSNWYHSRHAVTREYILCAILSVTKQKFFSCNQESHQASAFELWADIDRRIETHFVKIVS